MVVKGVITIEGRDINHRVNKKLGFKNNALLSLCKSKINAVFIGKAEGLDIVMPMYNLLELNYSITSESFWNYYRNDSGWWC